MTVIYDVDTNELIEKAAEELKKINEIQPPEWATFAKTGAHKERPPIKNDWWYMRTAAILRKLYRMGPIGVSKLRTMYGGKKNRGMRPARFKRGSGNIIRKAMQQLEKAGLAKQDEKGPHKGRVITPKGKSLLDKVASKILGEKPKKPKPVEKPVKAKKKAKPEEKKETPKPREKPETQKPVKPAQEKTEAVKEEKKKESTEAKEIIVEKPEKVTEEKPKPVEKETEKPAEEKPVEKTEQEEVKQLAQEVMEKGSTKNVPMKKNE